MKPIVEQSRHGIESIARMAMDWGARHLKDYGSDRSRHDFTQRQLMACLIVRACVKTTYRGLLELLSENAALREELALGDKLPHYTTLQKFNARNRILALAEAMMQAAPPIEMPMRSVGPSLSLVGDATRNSLPASEVKRFTIPAEQP